MELDFIWIAIGIAAAGYFMGISKEDAKTLIQNYPNIPHIVINDKVYYLRLNCVNGY